VESVTKMAKPQPEARRFLFDNSFDVARKPAKKTRPEDEVPPEPTFSKAQLDDARRQGYEQGLAAGSAEAAAGAAAELTRLAASVAEALPGVGAAQDAANGRLLHDGATLVAAIMRKILPSLVARNGLDEIDALLDRCLRTLIDQPKIAVRVAPRHADELRNRLEAAVSASGFGGRFMIETDEGLGASDCRVSWQGGGLERRSEDIWRQVEAALDAYLGTRSQPAAEPADTPVVALDTPEER
jgi:flagellar assembly protein FliH